MKRLWFKFSLYVAIAAGLLSCTGANLYKELASNKNTDEALYEDATKSLDAGNYTAAINTILLTSSGFQAQARVKESLAGAYAARCGMEFIPFVTRLTGNSSSSFFSLAMNGFVGISTAAYGDCKTAESIIEGIGSLGNRTQSENLFLMVLEMAKIGNRLRNDGDAIPTNGDGTVDAGFSCMTSVSIADAQEIVESFVKFLTLFGSVTLTATGTTSTQINDFIHNVGIPSLDYSGGLGPGVDEGDPAILAIRAIIYSQSLGIGSCNNADPTQCLCM
jgi:hypothetical protein